MRRERHFRALDKKTSRAFVKPPRRPGFGGGLRPRAQRGRHGLGGRPEGAACPPSPRSRSRPGRKSELRSSAAKSTRQLTPIGRPLSDISPGKLMFSCEQPPILRGLLHYSRMKSAPQKPCSGNNCMPEYSRVRGVIRRYSGLSKLRKLIFAFNYSRLLTWANAIVEGLNPPCSFNLVSAAGNRPSGDPNCK